MSAFMSLVNFLKCIFYFTSSVADWFIYASLFFLVIVFISLVNQGFSFGLIVCETGRFPIAFMALSYIMFPLSFSSPVSGRTFCAMGLFVACCLNRVCRVFVLSWLKDSTLDSFILMQGVFSLVWPLFFTFPRLACGLCLCHCPYIQYLWRCKTPIGDNVVYYRFITSVVSLFRLLCYLFRHLNLLIKLLFRLEVARLFRFVRSHRILL